MKQEQTPLIQINGLSRWYKMGGETVNALRQVTFTIQHGEFVAIIGPSGSGKSTLMNMIGCLDTPDEGTYFLDGQEVGKLSDNGLTRIRNEKLGFIFQGFNLLPKLSAFENVELPLIYKGIAQKQRRVMVQEALAKVGLESRMHHRPTELSGGQQQRVAVARALACNPQILLADEPTGALDSTTSKEILQLMREVSEQGYTVILITHDLYIADQAKRVIRVQDGEIVSDRGGAT
ncbi:peptide ABC transporter ATP-binding protein [Paenibacillus marchantiophytorum]|uniref:Peptide ABC transporter ATP-binding protein n=1 Tax=Paenibacillus marchantiophytorum TaxID=1619310 RepID=A0ABQ1EK91_9BACL|nr:ABC transporter ATP-binding protein [Paenibacillus marchantiophytorum]GFZ75843.1 peptide ABC transporter ATP-binding protein [Paenibacillus marchantiophytorum]